jgi:hypothetical protein
MLMPRIADRDRTATVTSGERRTDCPVVAMVVSLLVDRHKSLLLPRRTDGDRRLKASLPSREGTIIRALIPGSSLALAIHDL